MFLPLRSAATICTAVEFNGIGVHSGKQANMKIIPVHENTGITFKRTDVKNKNQIISLSAKSVVDPTLCTRVTNNEGVSVCVIEHLLAALRISGISNALVEIDAEEVPIMDGSASVFLKEFISAGILIQDFFVPAIVIKKPLTVESNRGSISILPSNSMDISVKISYERIDPVIRENNYYSFNLNDNLSSIAQARTFGWVEDCERVKSMGFGLGASEENTIAILPDNTIKNIGGLRDPRELVMHKCLDLIGDISVIGCDIIGRIEGFNTSHKLNNDLMNYLLTEESCYDFVQQNECLEKFERTANFA